jgi:CMP-N,N'-diacetyllegionaminic acid synthase
MYQKNKALVIIPARGGSKGIKDKNIYPINNKPLIYYSINAAKGSKFCGNLIVSTDSDAISNISEEYGAFALKRPKSISTDYSQSEDSLLHALNYLIKNRQLVQEWTLFIQCTSPLVETNDIDGAIQFAIDNSLDSVFSAYKYHFAGLWEKSNSMCKPINYDPYMRPMRQEQDNIFVENGAFYLIKTELLLKNKNRFGGKTSIYEMPFYRSFQVDTMDDISLIEKILVATN